MLTPKTVLPALFIVGIIFAPIGGLLLYSSDSVVEIVIDYTDCYKFSGNFVNLEKDQYSVHFPNSGTVRSYTPRYKTTGVEVTDPVTGGKFSTKRCTIQFSVPVEMKPPVFLYYKLSNFYQNHRKYVKSFDAKQLKGEERSRSQLNSADCANFPGPMDSSDTVYYPCGFIANSLFNDTVSALTQVQSNDAAAKSVSYAFSDKSIAWPSEPERYAESKYKDFNKVLPPPNWRQRYPNGKYTAETIKAVSHDQHFMVWMRTAGLPTFRKLWGRNEKAALPVGVFSIDIDSSNYSHDINL